MEKIVVEILESRGKRNGKFSPSDKLAIRKEQITSLLDGKVTKAYGRGVSDLLTILNKNYSFRIVSNLCEGIMKDFLDRKVYIKIGEDAERIKRFFTILGLKPFSRDTFENFKYVKRSNIEFLVVAGMGEADGGVIPMTFDEFLNKLNEDENTEFKKIENFFGVELASTESLSIMPSPTIQNPSVCIHMDRDDTNLLIRKYIDENYKNEKENTMSTNYLETEACVELTEQEKEEMKFINQAVKEGMKGFSGTKAEFSQRETELANQAKKEYEAFLKEAELLETGLEALDLGQLVLKVDKKNDTLRTTYMSTPKVTTELTDGKLVERVNYITGRTTQSVNDEQDDVIALAVAFYYSKFESNTQAKKFAELLMNMAREEAGIN